MSAADAIEDLDVVVVLAAAEEAKCPGNNCKFSFVEPTDTVIALTEEYNAETGFTELVLEGTGFDVTKNLVLSIDGIE